MYCFRGVFIVDRIKMGFVGVYANFVGGRGEATTWVNSLIIKEK